VQEGIYEPFKAALVKEVARMVQAVDRDGDADVGAMTTDFQVKIVAEHVADAKAKGAVFLTGAEWDGTSRLVPPMVVDASRDVAGGGETSARCPLLRSTARTRIRSPTTPSTVNACGDEGSGARPPVAAPSPSAVSSTTSWPPRPTRRRPSASKRPLRPLQNGSRANTD
jgi:hypothetical protein